MEVEAELKQHQLVNKALVSQANMIRDSEFLRDVEKHRELEKMDRVADRMERRAEGVIDAAERYPAWPYPTPLYTP